MYDLVYSSTNFGIFLLGIFDFPEILEKCFRFVFVRARGEGGPGNPNLITGESFLLCDSTCVVSNLDNFSGGVGT